MILNSSKTLAELQIWRERLGLTTPVAAENGGVLLMNTAYGEVKQLIGKPYHNICHFLMTLREQKGWLFEGFNDWSVAEVMAKTGLNELDAIHAKEREVTEPILWMDTPENLELFKTLLDKEQLMLNRGGRFYHVMAKHDKADAMRFLMNLEPFKDREPFKNTAIIALGDGENDLAMLRFADMAVVMPSATGKSLQIEDAYYSKLEAPNGWVQAIESICLGSNTTP